MVRSIIPAFKVQMLALLGLAHPVARPASEQPKTFMSCSAELASVFGLKAFMVSGWLQAQRHHILLPLLKKPGDITSSCAPF